MHGDRPIAGSAGCSAVLIAALVLAMLAASGMGAVHVPVWLLAKSLLLAIFSSGPLTEDQRIILLAIRLPRIAAAVLVGGRWRFPACCFRDCFAIPWLILTLLALPVERCWALRSVCFCCLRFR